MKKLIALLLAVVVTVTGICTVAVAEDTQEINRTPVIDGVLDEVYTQWETARIKTHDNWYQFVNNTTIHEPYDKERVKHTAYFTWDDDFIYLYLLVESKDTLRKQEDFAKADGTLLTRDQIDAAKKNGDLSDAEAFYEAINVYLDAAPSAPVDQATTDKGAPSQDFDRNCISGAAPYDRLQARYFPAWNQFSNYFRTDEGMFLTFEQFKTKRKGEAGYEDLEAKYLQCNGDGAAAGFINYENNTYGVEVKYARTPGEESFRFNFTTGTNEKYWPEDDDTEPAYTTSTNPAWWRNFEGMLEVWFVDYPDVVKSADPIEPSSPSEPSEPSDIATPPDATEDEPIEYGNVNGDKKIDATDALWALQVSVNKRTLDETAAKAADVDGNGRIEAADALLILKKAVNKIDKFPVEEK